METQNKLVIHHVAKRLPYGLKVFHNARVFTFEGIDLNNTIKLKDSNGLILYVEKDEAMNIRLILFPYSYLFSLISYKDENFIPSERIQIYENNYEYLIEQLSTGLVESIILEKLLKWNFDLPHEHLIEKGLAISVFDLTENPYAL